MRNTRHILAVMLLAAVTAAPAPAARGLTIKGSDTMVILGQRRAEQYMNANPGRIVQVTGGGSGTGIAALINGTTEICMASRPMKPDEKRKLRDRYQTMGVEIPVAKDPNGIGYGGAAYAKGVKECAVKKDDASPAVLPSAATVKDGSYPVTRDLYLYTRMKPAGEAKKFIDWVLSGEGQSLATEVGYFPVR